MLVSICIAVYNGEHTIRSVLDSILAQTYTDFEVIIVDDHSTDNTTRIVYNEYCVRDKRFKLFVNLTTKKYQDAHNLSYQLAKGKYLFRVDADDILYNDYLEYHVNFMENNPDVDAFSTRMKRCKIENGITRELTPEEDTLFIAAHTDDELGWFNAHPAYAFCGNTVIWSNPSSSLRKSFYDKYHPKYISYGMGDYIFWFDVLAHGGKLRKTNDIKSIHCSHSTNIAATDSNFYMIPWEQAAVLEGYKAAALRLDGYEEEAKKYDEEKTRIENIINGRK